MKKDEQLFLITDQRSTNDFPLRTSTPLLERKSLGYSKDDREYKKFRESLGKPRKSNIVLVKGIKMSLPNASFISGHLLTQEDLDLFNQPIIQDDVKQTISNRIFSLLNHSYKTLIRKSSGIFRKKRDASPSTCLNINTSECECRNHHFVDLKGVKNDTNSCNLHNANIIVI